MKIGYVLKKYRKDKGLTQEETAYRSGLNEKHYGRIEREEVEAKIDTIEGICKGLDITMIDLFLDYYNQSNKENSMNNKMQKLMYNAYKNEIDIHFNRNIIIEGCNSSIWYNGFIGSMNFEEFELLLYANGNIKGKLFKDFIEVLDLDSEDISNELQRYIKNDEELYKVIEYMYVDEEILNQKNGDALFLYDSNWLSIEVINNQKKEKIIEGMILDNNDILEIFEDIEKFMDYIFLEGK